MVWQQLEHVCRTTPAPAKHSLAPTSKCLTLALSTQESNGTVLSTNWKDIGKKKTEWQPPSGADAKKFEQ